MFAVILVLAVTTIVVIPNAWVGVIVGVFLPLVIGLLTHYNASDKAKAVVGILVAGLAVVLTQLAADGADAIITWGTVRLFLLTYGVQVMTYLGLWKHVPEGGINSHLAPRYGIGAPRVEHA